MANWGKAFQGLAKGFIAGRNIEEEKKRTKILEQEQADKAEDRLNARYLQQLEIKVKEKQAKLDEAKLNQEQMKMGITALQPLIGQEGVDPNRMEAITKNFKEQYGLDISQFWIPNKNEKTGVINSYGLKDKDVLKNEMDAASKKIDQDIARTNAAANALSAAAQMKKANQEKDPLTIAGALVKSFNEDAEFKKLSPEQQRAKLVEAQNSIASGTESIEIDPSTGRITIKKGQQAKAIEPGTKKEVEMGMYNMSQNLSDVQNIKETYSKEFLTYGGKFKNWTLDKLIKLDTAKLTPEEKTFVASAARFESTVNRMFNRYVHDMSGAAFSIKEMDRYKKSFFNVEQNSVAFEAVYNDFLRDYKKSYRLKEMYLREGADPQEIGKKIDDTLFLSSDPTLSKENINARGNALKELFMKSKKGTQEEMEMFVTGQLKKEGYLP